MICVTSEGPDHYWRQPRILTRLRYPHGEGLCYFSTLVQDDVTQQNEMANIHVVWVFTGDTVILLV